MVGSDTYQCGTTPLYYGMTFTMHFILVWFGLTIILIQ